jgi:branched-chain amino acid transport system permease protein
MSGASSRLRKLEAGALAQYAVAVLGVLFLALLPSHVNAYELLNVASFLIPGILALSLSLLWGYGGILSFGQAAFYGVGAYAFGVAGIDLAKETDDLTWLPLLVGLAVPVLFAIVLGWTMFYARLRPIHVAIMTLLVALLIQTFLLQTAGSQWKIGDAYLGGDNGLGRFSANIHEPPSLRLGVGGFARTFSGYDQAFYYLVLGLLVVVFVGLTLLFRSRYGTVLAGVRNDPLRTETFGHNSRRIQLVVFALSAGIAGLAGILYVSWGNFISPDAFGVKNAILPVIWVAVAGRRSLVGCVISAILLSWISQKLAISGNYSLLALGALLVVVTTLMPEGVVPAIRAVALWATGRRARPFGWGRPTFGPESAPETEAEFEVPLSEARR